MTDRRQLATEIVRRLRAAGHEAYLAGGCVRDRLLGREPLDYDVATSATPFAKVRRRTSAKTWLAGTRATNIQSVEGIGE